MTGRTPLVESLMIAYGGGSHTAGEPGCVDVNHYKLITSSNPQMVQIYRAYRYALDKPYILLGKFKGFD